MSFVDAIGKVIPDSEISEDCEKTSFYRRVYLIIAI